MFKKNGQKGIIPAILALIIGLVCIVILVLVLALIVYFNHIIAGLIGGGNQPNGNCNVGCGFDESKVDYYTKGNQPDIADATSEEAKDFAVNILKVDPTQIAIFDKEGTVENMIRAEVAQQWSQLKPEQQHGATQADAQHALLVYQEHESSAFQLFKKEGNRLVPSLTHDSSGVCTNILSITRDKWAGNKRKEIAIMWDIKYDIYLGVQENISSFINNASGSGEQRWKNAIGYTFWHTDPSRYWRTGNAEEIWNNKYQNEPTYNCQSPSSCSTNVVGNGECAIPVAHYTLTNKGYLAQMWYGKHRGLDFIAPTGTPVYATMDGTIVESVDVCQTGDASRNNGCNHGWGNYITIRHANNFYSEYHHLAHGTLLAKGTLVKKGQQIALSDNNGTSTGPHLHFQVMTANDHNAHINPNPCLGKIPRSM